MPRTLDLKASRGESNWNLLKLRLASFGANDFILCGRGDEISKNRVEDQVSR